MYQEQALHARDRVRAGGVARGAVPHGQEPQVGVTIITTIIITITVTFIHHQLFPLPFSLRRVLEMALDSARRMSITISTTITITNHLYPPSARSLRRVLEMALDIARGMAYLHSTAKGIIHRDLKPR